MTAKATVAPFLAALIGTACPPAFAAANDILGTGQLTELGFDEFLAVCRTYPYEAKIRGRESNEIIG